MKLKISKALLCILTILTIIVTSAFSVFGADSCKVTLSASKSSIKAGEEVTISVTLAPSSKGVGGFNFSVTYDTSKFEFVSGEKGSGYENITLYNGAAGVSGYNSDNVKQSYKIATFKFKAKSNISGKVAFSVNTKELFYVDGTGDYVDITPTVSKANVSVESAQTTTTTTKKTTTTTTTKKTTTTTTTKKTTTTTTTKKKTTTTTITPKKTTTTTTTPKKTTTTTTTPKQTTTTTTPVTVTSLTTTTPPETVTTPTETTTVATTTPAETTTEETTTTTAEIKIPENFDTYMFKYVYDSVDVFAENEDSNFIFDLSEYVDDFSKSYDLTVYVQVDGDVNASVAYNMDGQWTQNYFKTSDKIAEWNVENIKLEDYDTLIHIPVYFMSTGTTYIVGAVVVKDSQTGEILYNGLEKISTPPTENPESTTTLPPQTTPDGTEDLSKFTQNSSTTVKNNSPQEKTILPYLIVIIIPVLFLVVSGLLIVIIIKNITDAKKNNQSDDE